MGACCSVSVPQPLSRRQSSTFEAMSPTRVAQRNRRLGPAQASPRAASMGGRFAHSNKTTSGAGPAGSGSLNTTTGTNQPDSSASGTSAPLTLHNLQQHDASWSSTMVSCAPLPRFPGDAQEVQDPQRAHQELDEVIVHMEEGLPAPDSGAPHGSPISGSAHSALSAHQIEFGVTDVPDPEEECEHFEPLQMPSHLWATAAHSGV